MLNLFVIRPKGYNIGNKAIFQGMLPFIREAVGEDVNLISLPATSKYESDKRAGLTAKTIFEINQFGHGVLIGGGNLFENGELDLDLNALDALLPPLGIFSVSRGRIYNRRRELMTRTDSIPDGKLLPLLRKASVVGARDAVTHEYFESIGFDRSRTIACPTITLGGHMATLPPSAYHVHDAVLVSVRNPALMSIPLPIQARVYNDIQGIIAFLRDQGHRDVRILAHDHRDIPFAASFPGVDYVYTSSVDEYLSILKEVRLNISYRLHSVIPCVSAGIPVIPISYDQRSLSLLSTLGLGDWDINLVETDDLLADVRDRYARLASFSDVREGVMSLWDGFRNAMKSSFEEFGAAVRAYRESAE